MALKRIWKAFIQTKDDFLTFEKTKEEAYVENLRAKTEVGDFYLQIDEWDCEA